MGARTSTNELAERLAVVMEARTWLGTPYEHHQRVKGCGVDCAMFPVAVYSARNLMPADQDFGAYPVQWNLHHDEERYLEIVLRYADEIQGPPQSGDFVLWKFARAHAHGGIVTQWPWVIHSYNRRGVYEEDTSIAAEFRLRDGSPRSVRFFTLWRR